MKKVAFIGESGSGKDYLYNLVKKDFTRVSFSDPLKKIGSDIFEWMKPDYAPEEKESPINITTEFGTKIKMTPREIWLKLNFLRTIDPYVLIRKVKRKLSLMKGLDIIITDIRTQDEYDFCKAEKFKIIYIDNPENDYPKNSFDDFARSMKGKTDILYVNNKNQDKEFKQIIKGL